MTAPRRVRLRRTAGWRKPEGTVVVARPSRWGNPWRVGDDAVPTRAEAVARYAAWVPNAPYDVETIRRELGGHDLACWCPLDEPCHADVLLQLANPGP